jgi:hypothetical protein
MLTALPRKQLCSTAPLPILRNLPVPFPHLQDPGLTSSSSNDPFTSNPYGLGYGQVQQSYLASQTPSYSQSYTPGGSPYDSAAQGGSDHDPAGVRVVNSRPKPQCWDHGCNGRQFSTFSNLLRHQREKSGASQKSTCPRCGAVFTRTTARNGTYNLLRRSSIH